MGRSHQNRIFTFFSFDPIMDNERILQRKRTALSASFYMIIDIKFNFMIFKRLKHIRIKLAGNPVLAYQASSWEDTIDQLPRQQ